MDWFDDEMVSDFLTELKHLAKQHHSVFFKMEPYILKDDIRLIQKIQSMGFSISKKESQCKDNYILRLEGKTKEEMLASFKSHWRYNIRYAIKKGVICDFYGQEKIDDFYALMKMTSERHHVPLRPKSYFIDML